MVREPRCQSGGIFVEKFCEKAGAIPDKIGFFFWNGQVQDPFEQSLKQAFHFVKEQFEAIWRWCWDSKINIIIKYAIGLEYAKISWYLPCVIQIRNEGPPAAPKFYPDILQIGNQGHRLRRLVD
jgi:hypothetical protein